MKITQLFNSHKRQINQLQKKVAVINSLEKEISQLSDTALKEKTKQLKNKLQHQNSDLEEILPEAFAIVRESAKRVLGERAYDVQLLAGITLHQGKIAEQKTGEGKTLTAIFPLYLNALTGKGAHLVTVNDYLARRDCEWMGAIFHFLGLSVSCLNNQTSYLYQPQTKNSQDQQEYLLGRGKNLTEITRKEAYQADITYGTNNEFGFDYLRDNMARNFDQTVQTNSQGEIGAHHFAIVDEVDFLLIDQSRTPLIISAPVGESNNLYLKFAQLVPQLSSEYYEIDEKRKTVNLTELGLRKMEQKLQVENLYQNFDLVHHLEQAIKAFKLFQKDRDYIVKNNEVTIVDEFTGRLMPGRRYSQGLHQAIEAKENVPIQKESRTLATITIQNYFRMYDKLAGMTGTAMTEAEEFSQIYHLETVVIPTNKPIARIDASDQVYKNQRTKYASIVQDIEEKHQKGQPVLVGTTSVAKNQLVSQLLRRKNIPHQVLNAKNHQKEAEIVAQAGQKGAVTVATNMAGRGTNIKLTPETLELGGLHVIGTERHEARRIDNQLRGRSGRQGQPGSSRFYVALDDDLMRIFGGERIQNIMERFNFPEELPIEHPLITRSIEGAQKKVEGYNFDIRKHLVEYDDVVNRQREIIYKFRRQIMENQNLKERIEKKMTLEQRKEAEEKEHLLGRQITEKLRQGVYLITLDQLWMNHIDTLDELRRGINLRRLAEKNPLVEFKNEAYQLFQQLMENLDQETISRFLHARVAPQPQIKLEDIQAKQESLTPAPEKINLSKISKKPANRQIPLQKNEKEKIGRNDPCWCGSGKKYKHCHGK